MVKLYVKGKNEGHELFYSPLYHTFFKFTLQIALLELLTVYRYNQAECQPLCFEWYDL